MSSTIPKGLANESHLTCTICNHTIENPLRNTFTNAFKDTFTKSKTARGCIVSFIVMIGLLYMCGDSDSTSSSSSIYHITEDTYAAFDEITYNELVRYSLDMDRQAVLGLSMQGRIITLNRGTEVYFVSGKALRYNVVRLEGSHQKLWVSSSVVSRGAFKR